MADLDIPALRALCEAATADLDVLRIQFAAAQATLTAECAEHVELNGHIDVAEQAHDYLAAERDLHGDPGGKLSDFIASLAIVIEQCDRQRRRANWYEAAHTAGKQKLIEYAVAKETDAITAWLLGGECAHQSNVDLTDPDCPIGTALTLAAAAIRSGAWRTNTKET